MDYAGMMREIREKAAEVDNFVICKASTNNFSRTDRATLVHSYENDTDDIPDIVIEQLVEQLGLSVEIKDESGGRVYILPQEDL